MLPDRKKTVRVINWSVFFQLCFMGKNSSSSGSKTFPPIPHVLKIDFSVIIPKKIFFRLSSCVSVDFFSVQYISLSFSLLAYFSLAENVIEVGEKEREKKNWKEIGEGEIKCNFLLSSPSGELCERFQLFFHESILFSFWPNAVEWNSKPERARKQAGR